MYGRLGVTLRAVRLTCRIDRVLWKSLSIYQRVIMPESVADDYFGHHRYMLNLQDESCQPNWGVRSLCADSYGKPDAVPGRRAELAHLMSGASPDRRRGVGNNGQYDYRRRRGAAIGMGR